MWKASGAVNTKDEVGFTCTELDGTAVVATYYNTLDPECGGGALSCVGGSPQFTTSDTCTDAGYYWGTTTCEALQASTPAANCPALIAINFPNYAGGASKHPIWFKQPLFAPSLPHLIRSHVTCPSDCA